MPVYERLGELRSARLATTKQGEPKVVEYPEGTVN